jgi:hypothetical protein
LSLKKGFALPSEAFKLQTIKLQPMQGGKLAPMGVKYVRYITATCAILPNKKGSAV